MEITVYLAADDRFILTPTCFLPSNACRHEHGVLLRCGQINGTDIIDSTAWQCVLDDIEDHDFAALSRLEAVCLLGRGHACFAMGQPPPAMPGLPRARAEIDAGNALAVPKRSVVPDKGLPSTTGA